MTTGVAPSGRGEGTVALRAAAHLPTVAVWTSLTAVMTVVAVALTRGLNAINISISLSIVGGVGMMAVLLLAITRYEVAVGVGFLLMGVVRFEPAPPDGLFAIVIGVAIVTGRFKTAQIPRTAGAIVGLLLTISLLSMLDAVQLGAGIRYLFITVYLATFSLWLATFVVTQRRARLIVVAWLVVGTFSAAVSVLALYVNVPLRGVILGTYESDRAGGFFKDPNVFGPFLVPVLLIVLEQRLVLRQRPLLGLRGHTSLAATLCLGLGILFSYSRAAWANAVLGVAVLLVATSFGRDGPKRAIRTMVLLGVAGAMGVAVLVGTGSVGFLQERAKIQTYDTQRFAAQHVGYELGWTHPLGVGPGQFPSYSAVETHSSYVRMFAEQGPFGLVLWAALLLFTLVAALRNFVAGRDTHGIGPAALLAAWTGLILNSFVVDTLHWRHLWAVAGLIWAGDARRRATQSGLASGAARAFRDLEPASG